MADPQEVERTRFEAYILTERGKDYLIRTPDGSYQDHFVQEAWESWQYARTEAESHWKTVAEARGKDLLTRAQMIENLSAERDLLKTRAATLAVLLYPKERGQKIEPSPGLLMSMAIRLDHALGNPGYYDGPIFKSQGMSHKKHLEAALTTARQLFEEVTGQGFYQPEREKEYAELQKQVESA
jgi:hypothetical protein